MTNKERFIELLRSTKREGIEKLIDFLEKTDFFTAPASTRFHSSYEGGLLRCAGARMPIISGNSTRSTP